MAPPPLSAPDGLVKTSVQLGSDQLDALERIARERRTSVAAIVREAVDAYLKPTAEAVA